MPKLPLSNLLRASLLTTLSLSGASAVQAASITVTSGISSLTTSDNGAGDLDPTAGAVVSNGPVGDWNVTTTTGISYPTFGSADAPQVDLNNVSVSSLGATDSVQIVFNDLFSTTPGQTSFLTGIGGSVTNADISWQAIANCNHTSNPGCTAPLQEITSGNFTGEFSFSENDAASIDVSIYDFGNPAYDLDLIVTITPNDPGQASIASFDFQVSQVPVPAAVWLFGSALFGLGFVKRRKA